MNGRCLMLTITTVNHTSSGLLTDLELRHQLAEVISFSGKLMRRCRRLLNHCGLLLGDLVHLVDGSIPLVEHLCTEPECSIAAGTSASGKLTSHSTVFSASSVSLKLHHWQ